MIIKKLIISIFILFIIFLLLLFLKKTNKENFENQMPDWIKTIKCLKLDKPIYLNKIKKMLKNGENPDIALTKIINMAKKENLKDNEIFNCLIP